MAEVSYYFDSKSTSIWADSGYMIDDILTNYATTASDGATETLDGNSCTGDDLGTISKVELRAYGYGDGDDRIDLTPIFTLGDGDEHQLTMPMSAGWSAYTDITNDTNHPSWSFWSYIKNLDCRVEYDKVSKGNTMYCAKVGIRVTYTGGVPAGWNKIFYTSEPPTPNAWNQIKQEAGTGWRKLEYS